MLFTEVAQAPVSVIFQTALQGLLLNRFQKMIYQNVGIGILIFGMIKFMTSHDNYLGNQPKQTFFKFLAPQLIRNDKNGILITHMKAILWTKKIGWWEVMHPCWTSTCSTFSIIAHFIKSKVLSNHRYTKELHHFPLFQNDPN